MTPDEARNEFRARLQRLREQLKRKPRPDFGRERSYCFDPLPDDLAAVVKATSARSRRVAEKTCPKCGVIPAVVCACVDVAPTAEEAALAEAA